MATITIRATDSASALDEVLRLLGPDAMIVATRQVGGMVEITAAPPGSAAPAPPRPKAETHPQAAAPGFAERLARHTGTPAPAAPASRPALPDLPPRLILLGPPGAGCSTLAARLAAHALRQSDTCPRPLLAAPRAEPVMAPGPLDGWARLMGLRVDRPVWAGSRPVLPAAPAAASCQILDLSDVPALLPQDLVALAAPAGTQVWLVLPTGLHPDYQARYLGRWAEWADALVLTRTDLCPPTSDDLALPDRHGLPFALFSAGGGILDTLMPPPAQPHLPDRQATPTARRTEKRTHAAARLS